MEQKYLPPKWSMVDVLSSRKCKFKARKGKLESVLEHSVLSKILSLVKFVFATLVMFTFQVQSVLQHTLTWVLHTGK